VMGENTMRGSMSRRPSFAPCTMAVQPTGWAGATAPSREATTQMYARLEGLPCRPA
jgi:hypothetical protein